MRRLLFLLIVCLSVVCAKAQELDTLALDSAFTSYEEEPETDGISDTTTLQARDFDQTTIRSLKQDPDLQYKEQVTVGESLWERFLQWLGDFIESIFKASTTTAWGQVMIYVLLFCLAVIVVMWILKVNAFKVITGQGADTFRHDVLDEDIHEMDFDKLIAQAMAANDYRLAVRLVFLHALKMLSDKNLVHWDRGKTNHDYLDELEAEDLKKGLNELNYYFEYAWYGNFRITPTMFSHVRNVFDQWRSKV